MLSKIINILTVFGIIKKKCRKAPKKMLVIFILQKCIYQIEKKAGFSTEFFQRFHPKKMFWSEFRKFSLQIFTIK
ncbi:hypothetical protein OA84_10000 [Kaistella solincola]|uniref:Ribosomal protein L32 n=1 Tax=Kaistella solincola TaxID=510955 RepID=A0ABR4ZRV2_9FLAO|nr:hypothetical protein OA84_10000 [Kaistella solincola]